MAYNEIKIKDEEEDDRFAGVKLRKERFYLNQIARLKKTLSDYRIYIGELEQQNKKTSELLYRLTNHKIGIPMEKKPVQPVHVPENVYVQPYSDLPQL